MTPKKEAVLAWTAAVLGGAALLGAVSLGMALAAREPAPLKRGPAAGAALPASTLNASESGTR